MLQLNNLEKITKKRKRIGRGGARGGTSGKGHKGQKARTGSSSEIRAFFEGGQMPLARRVPRRGFVNFTKKLYTIINLDILESNFENGTVITKELLREKRIIKSGSESLIKVLGDGTLTKQFTVVADAFSKSAIEAINKNKGNAQLIKEMSSGSVTA